MKSCKIWGRTFSALVLGIILFAENSSFARTRAEVLDTAKIYADLPWKPTTYNLLDVKNHRDNITEGDETKIDGSDGIDDRAFKWDDSLNPPQWVFSTRNWPFEVCSTCTYHGEVYAYAGYYVRDFKKITWGADTVSTFTAKLAETPNKWIAGALTEDVAEPGTPTTMPGDYKGFAGIDCSGFVGNVLDVSRFAAPDFKLGVGGLQGLASPVEAEDLKPGDIISHPGTGAHVVLFVDWINKPYTARIIHASYKSFSKNQYDYHVSEDSATIAGTRVDNTLWARVVDRYYPHSLFPQFAWTSPTKDNPELDPLVPVIALEVVSKSSVAPSSVKLVIDEGKPGAVVITPGTTGYALAPSTSNSTHVSVRYEFPPDLALSSGPHSVTAYAGNIIGLNDISSMTFQVVPGTNPPTIAWQDLVPPGIFGELKGSNAFDTAPWLHGEGVTLHLWPDRNPLGGFDVYLDDTMSVMLATVPFVAGTRAVDVGDALTGFPDKTGYYARLADVLGNTTTMYFHLDKEGPIIETTVTVRLGGGSFVFDPAGRALDAMSGIGGEVVLSTGFGTVPEYPGPAWPPGPAETSYAFEGLFGDYAILAYDRSGWPGHFNLVLSTWTQTLTLSNRELVNDSASGGNAGAVLL